MMFDFGTGQAPQQQDMQKQALIQMLAGPTAMAGRRSQPGAPQGVMGGVADGVKQALSMYAMKQRMPMMQTPQAMPGLTGAGDIPMVG